MRKDAQPRKLLSISVSKCYAKNKSFSSAGLASQLLIMCCMLMGFNAKLWRSDVNISSRGI